MRGRTDRTYTMPPAKTEKTLSLRLSEVCSAQTIGSGIKRMPKFVMMLIIQSEYKILYSVTRMHFPSIVGNQVFRMGLHLKSLMKNAGK